MWKDENKQIEAGIGLQNDKKLFWCRNLQKCMQKIL